MRPVVLNQVQAREGLQGLHHAADEKIPPVDREQLEDGADDRQLVPALPVLLLSGDELFPVTVELLLQ